MRPVAKADDDENNSFWPLCLFMEGFNALNRFVWKYWDYPDSGHLVPLTLRSSDSDFAFHFILGEEREL